jgi:hypothetical protein
MKYEQQRFNPDEIKAKKISLGRLGRQSSMRLAEFLQLNDYKW